MNDAFENKTKLRKWLATHEAQCSSKTYNLFSNNIILRNLFFCQNVCCLNFKQIWTWTVKFSFHSVTYVWCWLLLWFCNLQCKKLVRGTLPALFNTPWRLQVTFQQSWSLAPGFDVWYHLEHLCWKWQRWWPAHSEHNSPVLQRGT